MKIKRTPVQLILLLICCLNLNIEEVEGEKIITLLFFTSKSIKNAIDPILYELAKRGHEVTIVSPIPSTKETKNVREIVGPNINHVFKNMENPYERKENRGFLNPFRDLIPFFETVCESMYEMPEVEKLKSEKFDLVIVSGLMNECAYGLMHYFNTTSIAVSPLASPVWLSPVFGAPTPPSFVPLHFTELTDNMRFLERIENTLAHIWVEFMRRYYFVPAMEANYRKYLPEAPGILEIEKNFSLVLMNSHPVLNYPRPLMPDMIEVGGIHCQPAKPLPKDLEDFVTGAGSEGFIFFSMGSILRADQMPEKYRKDILATFSKLRQRVVWKWEGDTMKDLPPNVKLSAWLPQQDLLGHPNIRLFITHGGLLSTQEAVYHGVPLIGIPMVLDQVWNVKQAENSGYALALQFPDITEKTLGEMINRILSEPRFSERAKSLSAIFRDQPEKPLDRAIFWTEYVLRKGAGHLRSPARDLNLFQYHSLDVVLFLSLIVLICVSVFIMVIRFLVTKLCTLGKTNTPKKSKKKRQ